MLTKLIVYVFSRTKQLEIVNAKRAYMENHSQLKDEPKMKNTIFSEQ